MSGLSVLVVLPSCTYRKLTRCATIVIAEQVFTRQVFAGLHDDFRFTLQSRGAPTCSATNEVCQYYQSALCGSNFLVCCVLLWPRMPQLLATTVFGLQGRF